MVDEGNDLVLAPIEDALEEGEVNVEDGSGEDAPDLHHATNVASSQR